MKARMIWDSRKREGGWDGREGCWEGEGRKGEPRCAYESAKRYSKISIIKKWNKNQKKENEQPRERKRDKTKNGLEREK